MKDFISKWSPTEKKIFYVTLIFVTLALFDRLFLGPILSRLDVITQEIDQQKVNIKRDKRFLNYKDKILKDINTYRKYFTEKLVDDDVVNEGFLAAIERMATMTSINLIKSNPIQPKKDRNFIEYYANLDCSGDLENMVKFMHAISSSEDLFKIIKFNISPKRGTPSDVNVSLTISKLIMLPQYLLQE